MGNEDIELIQELGIESLTPEEQKNIIDEYKMQIGELLMGELSAERIEEFQAIADGDQEVIDRWLSVNAPDYQSTDVYKALTVGYEDDPEKVPADKVFASMAWIQQNSPDNYAQKIEEVKQEIKANIDQYR